MYALKSLPCNSQKGRNNFHYGEDKYSFFNEVVFSREALTSSFMENNSIKENKLLLIISWLKLIGLVTLNLFTQILISCVVITVQ